MASTDARPEPKGYLCAQDCAFNLHAARRVAPNDKQGREMLCRYILRPPMANERLHLLADGRVELEFKRPCIPSQLRMLKTKRRRVFADDTSRGMNYSDGHLEGDD